MTVYEIVSIILEGLVVVILIVEFIYDYNLNTHVKSLKRRTKRRYDFESLNQGDSK